MTLNDLGAADYRWTCVTDEAAFRPRDGAGALVFNDRMFLLGGWNPSDKEYYPRTCVNDVWSSADGADWELVKPNTFTTTPFYGLGTDWEGTHTAGYAVHDGKMWIVGGDPLQGHYQPDVWNSDDGRTWQHVNPGRPVPWCPRVLHHTFVLRGKMWILGGQTLPQFAPADEVFYHDIWHTEDGLGWTRVEMSQPFTPARGMIGGRAVLNGRVWLLGGGTYETPNQPQYAYCNDVWSSTDGVNWQRHIEHAPWRPRVYHDVAAFDDRIWVMEGQIDFGVNADDVWYSSDGVNWHEVPETPWKPRHAAGVFVYDHGLWVVAGNNMESDVWNLQRVE